jgi:hypothetical protein
VVASIWRRAEMRNTDINPWFFNKIVLLKEIGNMSHLEKWLFIPIAGQPILGYAVYICT